MCELIDIVWLLRTVIPDCILRLLGIHLMTKKQAQTYRLRGRLWIEGPEGTFLGYGRVVLLERIRDCGSISAAARSMEMSYRHAWELVDSMNRQSSSPVVEKSTGGKGGGGAKVTEAGQRAIEVFWAAHKDYQQFLAERGQGLGLA